MKINKRVGAAITASALALGLLVSPMENIMPAVGSSVSAEERIVFEHLSVTANLPDRAELEKLYIEKLFYGEGISLYKDYGETALTGATKELYSLLKTKVKAIADGTENNTSFQISMTQSFTDIASMQNGLQTAVRALMADMPASFYWYDKTIGNSYSYSSSGGYKVVKIIFEVSEDYMLSGGKTETVNYSDGSSETFHIQTDTSKIGAASVAVSKALEIVEKYDGLTDYEKVMGYREEICNLTDYNDDAAADENTPYGDPWQLVWVFDGDPDTKVVCEGYSKAFQYLCDLGGVECYTVGGWADVNDKNGSRHMWNIVVMNDGKSYLVDVTYSDGEYSAGENVILKGAVSSSGTGFTVNLGWEEETREYYPETISLYPEDILTVSTTDYTPPAPKPKLTVPESTEAQYDDAIAIVCESKNVPSSEKLTATSSNTAVADVEIADFNAETGAFKLSVTGKGAGKVTITVTYTGEDGTEVSSECELTLHKWKTVLSYDETHHWYACEDPTCKTEDSSAEHNMEDVADSAKEATCTKDGKEADKACVCGYTITGETIKSTGHTKGESVHENIVDATCIKAGSYDEVIYCTVCNEKISTTHVTGKTLPHEMEDVPNTAKEATCGEDGKEADQKCKNCDHTVEGAVIPATGEHTDGEPVRENEKPASCTKEGSYDEVVYCTVCDEEISRTARIIEKVPHTPGTSERENDIAPSCTKDGSYDMVTKCTECGETIGTEHVVVPAEGHDFGVGVLVQGETTHYQECTKCHEKVGEKPHTENSGTVTTKPTDTADGARTYSCSVCGKELRTEIIPALGENHEHSYTILNSDASGHWNECVCGTKDTLIPHNTATKEEVVLEAVCNADGLKYFITYCTDCGWESTQIEDIPKTGIHIADSDYGKDSTGHWNTCIFCGTVMNKASHEAGSAATEEAPQTCTVCGYIMAPMLVHSHTFSTEWKNDGSSHWHECRCGEKADIAAHRAVSEITKAPTATATGIKRYYCSICKYAIGEEVIPATGTSETPLFPTYPSGSTLVFPSVVNENEPKLDNDSGKSGWKSIADDIKGAENGSSVYVDMNGTATLSKIALKELAGKNVDLVLEMNDRITWTINGETVEKTNDVNMRARLNTNNIPDSVIETVSDGNSVVQLSLSHNGSFGFDAVMTVTLGTRFDGMFANLMYYDSRTKALEFIDCSMISGGKAVLDFSHASDYAVVISNEPMGEYEDVSAASGIYESNSSVPYESAVYAVITVMFSIAAAVAIFRKRVKK